MKKATKEAILTLLNDKESYRLTIKTDIQNDTWLKLNNFIVLGYQLELVKQELKNDGFKVKVINKR